ncbi:alpha/beta fold hydrolase [Microbacterium sp.]|uniref:alpha/beta fold hydrolase n=1 Tax=Microbacterium sp. TaxID=51671 RepID=UPI003A8C698F
MSEPGSTADSSVVSTAEREFGLTPGQFPFESRFVEMDGARLHYVNEGEGPVLLLIHGNPAWSFLYRHVIRDLSTGYRCIAVDLAGFGLSRPPEGFGFLPSEQAELVRAFIDELDLTAVTLVAHDWGGPIGLAALTARPDRLAAVSLGNTWAWPVADDRHFRQFSGVMGGPVGRFLNRSFAFFVNVVMPMSMKRRKLTPDEMRAYRAPFHARA